MLRFAEGRLIEIASAVIEALGAPPGESHLVATELVAADAVGVHSHGLLRIPQYAEQAKAGDLIPGASVVAEWVAPAFVKINVNRNFGQVGAHIALDEALPRAREIGIVGAVLSEAHHTGRLGSYAERAAREGFICLAFGTVRPSGHFVAPWGGVEGRLGTNPIAFAVPTETDPIVSDFATSVIPEGSVRIAQMAGRDLPEGAAIDALGNPITDPAEFYGPPAGALLPFGGPVGYKGYGLALMAELLAGSLVGSAPDDPSRAANGLLMLLLEPGSVTGVGVFEGIAEQVRSYVQSTTPVTVGSPVLLPGDIEAKHRDEADRCGVELSDSVWAAFTEVCDQMSIDRQIEETRCR